VSNVTRYNGVWLFVRKFGEWKEERWKLKVRGEVVGTGCAFTSRVQSPTSFEVWAAVRLESVAYTTNHSHQICVHPRR